jgi:hypothetical protein
MGRPPAAAPAASRARLVVAGVRAAVIAPERELRTWFSWPLPPGLIDKLVAAARYGGSTISSSTPMSAN